MSRYCNCGLLDIEHDVRHPFTLCTRKLPKFVLMHEPRKKTGTTLRLMPNGDEYWRDAGAWGVGWKIEGGVLMSRDTSDMKWLNNKLLTPITKREYLKTNVGYITSKQLTMESNIVNKNDIPY